MTGNKSNSAPGNARGTIRRRAEVIGATLAMVVAGLGATACLPLPTEPDPDGCPEPATPQPLFPGERVGWVRVDTVPRCLPVRIVAQILADIPAEILQPPEREGPAPQISWVSYQPGHNTQLVVNAFLRDPLAEGEAVTLSCEVYSDGELLPGSEDVITVTEPTQQTDFVNCVFNESLAPPAP